MVSLILGAADQNGYLAKYGKEDVERAISWGMGVADPRSLPPRWNSYERPLPFASDATALGAWRVSIVKS